MLYQQTTEQAKFLNIVGGLAPSTIAANIQLYKRNRATVLALPMESMAPGGGPPQRVQTSVLKLSERLAALGATFGPIMMANSEHKAFIEKQVTDAVAALDGFDKIIPSSEWGFLLSDPACLTRDPTTQAVIGYSLPGLTFTVAKDGKAYSVTINVDPATGVGTAAFTKLTAGDIDNGDPI